MFEWLNKQGVKSSNGFVLQRIHRFYYHYIYEERKMQVFVEPFTDKRGHYLETIDHKSFDHWLPPDAGVPITDEEREEIQKNVSEALAFMGIDHRFAGT